MIPEPRNVYPETELQTALVALVRDILKRHHRQYAVIENFGLDVAVFMTNGSAGTVRLFEVKAFDGQRMGGVGFGNQKGIGTQVELLLCSDAELKLFDTSIRWAYGDARRDPGERRYALFTCDTAKKAAMGGSVAHGKQNNLRVSTLQEFLVDWDHFSAQVEGFLLA